MVGLSSIHMAFKSWTIWHPPLFDHLNTEQVQYSDPYCNHCINVTSFVFYLTWELTSKIEWKNIPSLYFIWQTTNIEWNKHLTLWRLEFLYNLRRLSSYTRSSLISSFRSTLSNLKRGQQYLGALVAVVRSNRYINVKQRNMKTIWSRSVNYKKKNC